MLAAAAGHIGIEDARRVADAGVGSSDPTVRVRTRAGAGSRRAGVDVAGRIDQPARAGIEVRVPLPVVPGPEVVLPVQIECGKQGEPAPRVGLAEQDVALLEHMIHAVRQGSFAFVVQPAGPVLGMHRGLPTNIAGARRSRPGSAPACNDDRFRRGGSRHPIRSGRGVAVRAVRATAPRSRNVRRAGSRTSMTQRAHSAMSSHGLMREM